MTPLNFMVIGLQIGKLHSQILKSPACLGLIKYLSAKDYSFTRPTFYVSRKPYNCEKKYRYLCNYEDTKIVIEILNRDNTSTLFLR